MEQNISPKKILIFSLAYYPSFVSGAEAAIKEITDRIEQQDIVFHMVTLLFDTKAPREERIGNVIVHRVGFGGAYLSKILFIPLSAWKARRLHVQESFDGLWAMMTYMLFPLVCARWIGVRVPYMVTLQDGDPYEKVFERWFIRPVAWLLDYGFRHATCVQVISAYLATWPRRRGYRGAVVMVHNGGNPRDFEETDLSAEKRAALETAIGKKDGDIFLVNTARLVYQKGFDDTIRALTLLPPQIKFLVVGGGPDEEMLKKLADEVGVQQQVVFTGPIDRDEVTAYRRIADIFVMPSRSEGLGNAGLSAMASRLPFVGTREGGLAEYVFGPDDANPYGGQTAWVVKKDSPEEIARAVQEILGDPLQVAEVTARARTMVEKHYHWDAIAREMRTEVFSRIIG